MLQWVKSIECYHRALAINPLFENAWFVLGCAAMRAEDWDQAVRAFSRVTHINSENGEAWTNLASVYIKQGQKYVFSRSELFVSFFFIYD